MKTALVLGAGGFIGSHLVKRLKKDGYWVRGVDLKHTEFSETEADDFVIGDLRDEKVVSLVTCLDTFCGDIPGRKSMDTFDLVFQLAADMGGAGFVFTGENDSDIMHNSALINLNVLNFNKNYKKIFYSSSACIYPERNQLDPNNPNCVEDSAYPADPDSEYGWEKLFSERLYFAFARNYNVNVRVARFHNIFGPEGTWDGGREKAPAALCRKVLMAKDEGEIEIWGPGTQTRSFLYIDECVEAIVKLMHSDFVGPVNVGSEEMISINDFALMIMEIEGKNITLKNIPGPEGVAGRNSDNTLIEEKLGWKPSQPLITGMTETYYWIQGQIEKHSV